MAKELSSVTSASRLVIVVPIMILVPAGADGDVKDKLDVKV